MANYIIIGGDGKEYGPVTDADVRQWIAASRVNAQSQAKAVDDAEFRPLAKFPEFADAFMPPAAGALTPPPGSASSTPSTPVKTSGLAVTSLILGILGVVTCGVTALVGLILGIVAMVKVKNSGGKLGGNGIALAGVIVSGVFLFMIPILAALLLPALAAAKEKAQSINCVNNEKQLALAIRIYSGDNQDRLPPAATWCDAIKAAAGTEKIFQCPAANSGSRCDYAFNAKLGGLDLEKVAPNTVMLFEADRGWNANGGSELMIVKSRHARVWVVTFVDGSVHQLRANQLATLRWNP